MDILDQSADGIRKNIYNPKTNRMIIINGSVYRKLLHGGYMHWREERLLIPPLHELPILRRYLSFISYHIWDIISERSLLAIVNEKISLLQILLKANWHNLTLCQLLKLCWRHEETKAWRNNILMKFLHHPNLAPSKYRPSALYNAFTKTNILGPEYILVLSTYHNMSAIATKFVTDHQLINEMSIEELSQYAPEMRDLLGDDREKRRQARNRLQKGYNFSKEQAFALIPSQRTGQTKSQVTPKEGEVEAEVNICCAKSACQVSDIIPEGEIIRETAQRIMRDSLGMTTLSNKIQKEKSLLCEDEGIHYPDHFLLESVKERLDSYDVSNIPDKQALADVMIMLCIRPVEIKDLRISNGGVTGYVKN
ncbi:hypothetical protein GLOIN_2v1841986 [Rhizophagus clarus]|uniref:Uncharacterized protein n=1 Tax=Rhizophagus clarus TaxID=94130 RepID=A0A8H3QCC0_9GLOM|nr:hypothetical protein GLOIN_2v1841986 [Rhizophagus clarus]